METSEEFHQAQNDGDPLDDRWNSSFLGPFLNTPNEFNTLFSQPNLDPAFQEILPEWLHEAVFGQNDSSPHYLGTVDNIDHQPRETDAPPFECDSGLWNNHQYLPHVRSTHYSYDHIT